MTEKQEKPDNFLYNWLTFYPDSMKFFLSATRYYQERLTSEVDKIKSDSLFKELFDEKMVSSLEVTKEINRFKSIGDRLQGMIKNHPDASDYDIHLSHKDVRILKALCILYLDHLQKRRDDIASNNKLSTVALQAIDSRISRFQELISAGVFKEATPLSLLIEDVDEDGISQIIDEQFGEPMQHKVPRPRILSTIEIIDQQLRDRCIDLLETFDEENQTHRFDTVISEATRVLEDRVRRLSNAENSLSGVNLMTFAFGGDEPRLLVSEELSEQESAHLMYRGAIGFIRNPFHHRLIEDVSRDRVLQILGLIDYLIFVAQNATPLTTQDS